MQRVVTLTNEPVVGERYLVPCARLSLCERQRYVWIPVLGPEHEDTEIIGFSKMHWHYDLRFIREEFFHREGPPPVAGAEFLGVLSRMFKGPVREMVRVCHRRMPAYPTPVRVPDGSGISIFFIPKLERAYANAQVIIKDGCHLCPHRGLPLDGLPEEKDGVVTCRGHGLRWAKDGKLVPR